MGAWATSCQSLAYHSLWHREGTAQTMHSLVRTPFPLHLHCVPVTLPISVPYRFVSRNFAYSSFVHGIPVCTVQFAIFFSLLIKIAIAGKFSLTLKSSIFCWCVFIFLCSSFHSLLHGTVTPWWNSLMWPAFSPNLDSWRAEPRPIITSPLPQCLLSALCRF